MCAAATAVAGCSYFGDDKPARDVSARPVGKLTTECARLQPLFAADVNELTREGMDGALKVELATWDKDANGELSNREVEPLNDALREENVGASPVTDWNGDGRVSCN